MVVKWRLYGLLNFSREGFHFEGDCAIGVIVRHSAAPVPQVLRDVTPQESKNSQLACLPDMHQLMPQKRIAGVSFGDVDALPERDRDRATMQPGAQPPRISDANDGFARPHLQSAAMRKLMIVVFVFAATSVFAQQDFSKIEIKVQKVAGTVYMLTGAGGNIGVSSGDDGIVIVDDQFAPLAPKIREALHGITAKPIKFILNTHYHGDHTGGNESFSHDGPIIAHENVRTRLAAGSKNLGGVTPPAPKDALPVITFNDRATIHVNGEDIRAVHFPHGHTDGDSIIFFAQSNVVHMGDDFFNGMYPFVDTDNGGSVRGMLAAVDKVLSTMPDDAKVIPGHGPLSDKAGLRAFAEVLRGTTKAVATALAAGKTLDQMKAENILAPWDAWGKGFIKTDAWLATLVNEAKK
jgi:cyclase